MTPHMLRAFLCTKDVTIVITPRVQCLIDDFCIWNGQDLLNSTKSNLCASFGSILGTKLVSTSVGWGSTQKCYTFRQLLVLFVSCMVSLRCNQPIIRQVWRFVIRKVWETSRYVLFVIKHVAIKYFTILVYSLV